MEKVEKYKWRTIGLSIAFILCMIVLTGCNNSSQTSLQISSPLIEPPVIKKNCPKVKIWKIALLEWNNPLPLKIVEELQPYPGGAYSNAGIPGPKHKLTRPYLKTFVSPGGILGNLEQGDSKNMLVAVRLENNPKLIQLTKSPSALSARQDGGMWVNFGGTLVHYDADGKQIRSIKNLSPIMVNVERDAVWSVDFEKTASFVSANGEVKGPYPWDGFRNSSAQGQNLCRINHEKPGEIVCLEPSGKQRSIPLTIAEKASGKVLKFTEKAFFTFFEKYFSYYDSTGIKSELKVENAGLTTTGEAFISLSLDEDWSEVCISDGTSRWTPVKYDKPLFKGKYTTLWGKMVVVAVDGDRTLTFGYDSAKWWRNNQIEKSLIVGENGYRQNVFPHEWLLNPKELKALNADDGTVIMSVTGPTGIALIGLRWNP